MFKVPKFDIHQLLLPGVLVVVLFAILAAVIVIVQGPALPPGIHKFDVPPSRSPQVVIFISPLCKHCQALERALSPHVAQWQQQGVTVEYVPVRLGLPDEEPYINLVALIRTLGATDPLLERLFTAVHDTGLDLRRQVGGLAWLAGQGYNRARLISLWDSPEVKQLSLGYQAAAARYQVNAVPYLVVNGVWGVDPSALPGDPSRESIGSVVSAAVAERLQAQ